MNIQTGLDLLVKHYGGDKWAALEKYLSTAPKTTVFRINTIVCPDVEQALSLLQEALGPKWTIRKLSEHGSDVLGVDALQDSEPPPLKDPINSWAILDVKCAESVMRGSHAFAPGVVSVMGDGPLYTVYADIHGKCLKGVKRLPSNLSDLHQIGMGKLKMSREEILKKSSKGVALEMTWMPVMHPPFPENLSPVFILQNGPSLLVARTLVSQTFKNNSINASTQLYFLDMCASPGGKCTHLAALLNQQQQLNFKIFACDRSVTKLKTLQETINRLQCPIKTLRIDATRSTDIIKAAKDVDDSFTGHFDGILLDPPCSGIGQRPRLNFPFFDNLASFAEYQERLLESAWSLLKSGGHIVYSTCTLNPLENEQLIERFCKGHPDSKSVIVDPFGQIFKDELGDENGGKISFTNDKLSIGVYGTTFYPVDSIGFFIAHLLKQDNKLQLLKQ